MSTTTTTPTNGFAEAFATMVDGMIETRRQYAADHGFDADDDEIYESVKSSLTRMMLASVAS